MTPGLRAQQITQAQIDSGWVSAFDGKSLNGFYSIVGGGAPNNDLVAKPDGVFSVQTSDSSIHLEGSWAHIITKKLYCHYRIRVREKFDRIGNLDQNAGMLYHTRIEGPRLGGAYPRSIEFQGQKRGMGELWTISNVYINTTVDSAALQPKYKFGGKMVTHGNPNGCQCLGSSVPYVDGEWNMRWSDKDDSKDMSNMLKEGSIALQAEGSPVSYRDYMIMELDPLTGKPLTAKPTLAGSFPPAPKRKWLHAEYRNGGLVIRYLLGSAAGWMGESGRLSIRTLEGRLLASFSFPENSGEVYWQGMEIGAKGPLVLQEHSIPITTRQGLTRKLLDRVAS